MWEGDAQSRCRTEMWEYDEHKKWKDHGDEMRCGNEMSRVCRLRDGRSVVERRVEEVKGA